MKHFLPVLFALILVITPLTSAWAGIEWCKDDPLVRIDDSLVRIEVALPAKYSRLVKGPIQVDIQAPHDDDNDLLTTAAGFNRHGETVTFSRRHKHPHEDDRRVVVRVHVPVDARSLHHARIPMIVTVTERGHGPVRSLGTTQRTQVVLEIHGG